MLRVLCAALALLGALSLPSHAQRGPHGQPHWVLLGKQTVGFGVDRDVIRVGQGEEWFRREGPFRSLRFNVQESDIHLINIRIVYLNGFAEDYRFDRLVARGTGVAIDLRGERSFIRQIEMVYRSRPSFRGRAVVSVYGEAVRRGPPPAAVVAPPVHRGELLGKQTVGFGVDRDVIHVGGREGKFRAISLAVEGNDVEFVSLRVIYGNGKPDELPVRRLVRAGTSTGPIDLRGDRRFINRVEMVYRTRAGFRGRAEVLLYGHK